MCAQMWAVRTVTSRSSAGQRHEILRGVTLQQRDDVVQHLLGQLAGERVLLTDVIAAHEACLAACRSDEHSLGRMSELRQRTRHAPAQRASRGSK